MKQRRVFISVNVTADMYSDIAVLNNPKVLKQIAEFQLEAQKSAREHFGWGGAEITFGFSDEELPEEPDAVEDETKDYPPVLVDLVEVDETTT